MPISFRLDWMSERESAELWDQLYRELALAEKEFNRIQKEMDRMVPEGPAGVPFPDGHYGRMKLGNEAQMAFGNYKQAVERFRAFARHRVGPDGSLIRATADG